MMGRDASQPKDRVPRPPTHPEFPSVTLLQPEAKRLWVEALRTDRFRQGRNYLAKDIGDGVTHCCLGVLCEVAIEAGVDVPRVQRGSGGSGMYVLSYDGQTATPPDSVQEWAWGTTLGTLTVVRSEPSGDEEVLRERSLADLNDTYNLSFAQIADAIEDSL